MANGHQLCIRGASWVPAAAKIMSIFTQTLCISNSISIIAKFNYRSWEEERATEAGEPGLVISLNYMAYVHGESFNVKAEFEHNLADSSPSSLEAAIAANEPIPMDCIMATEEAGHAREAICNAVAMLIGDNTGNEGLEILKVKIKVKSEVYERELLGKRRMLCLKIDAYVSRRDGEEERCAICLENMEDGEEMARTPCSHHFHAACIKTWFENSGDCPMCRSRISL